jgi:hypothetical protein
MWVMGLVVVLMAGVSKATVMTSDDFSSSTLGSQWQANPGGTNSTVTTHDGKVYTTATYLDGDWKFTWFNTADGYYIPKGDFSTQIDMGLEMTAGYWQDGYMTVAVGDQRFQVSQSWQGPGAFPVTGSYLSGSGASWVSGTAVNMTYSSIQMKIERTGTTVTMYARPISDPAMDWSTLYTVTGTSTDVATVSFTTHNNSGNAITVWWDNFVLTGGVPKTPAPAPTFTPGGKYISGPTQITIFSEISGASIYYTTNGNIPTTGGTAYPSPVTVEVNNGTNLQAIAVAENYNPSAVTSLTFEVPSTYNRPEWISYGSATVDGNLSDWSNATWVTLDKINLNDSYTQDDAEFEEDVPEAYYAARWSNGKIYIAVKVHDLSHYFVNSYSLWNDHDGIEVFLHTDANDNTDYHSKSTSAQQYEIGITNSNHSAVWAYVGSNGAYNLKTSSYEIAETAGVVGGTNNEWLYYELALTPYTYFGLLETNDLSTTKVTNLFANEVIGLDVEVIANSGGAYMGKKSENTLQPKYNNWTNFGKHKLAAPTPGDANGDGKVDVGDLGILAANYGLSSGATWNKGDFNNDGKVDVGDLGILAANYGTGTSGADFQSDYAKVFGCDAADEDTTGSEAEDTTSTICNSLGLSLIAGLGLFALMLVKLEK